VPGLRERRRPGHFRICGACGKRNKARRSACARCGQPLRGIPEAIPGARRLPFSTPSTRHRWLAVAGVALAVAAGIGVHRLFRSGAIAPAGQSVAVGDEAAVPSEGDASAPPASPPSAQSDAEARAAGERGERQLARGDFRAAALLLSDAARIRPQDARIANAYGRALRGLGSRDRALFQFERAARLDSGVVAYRLDYARSLAEAGRAQEAAREYEAVGTLEPGNAAAAEALARMPPPAGAPGAAGGTIDMGGAAAGTGASPASGVFTNEDLSRGARPTASPLPPSPFRPSPSPSPF
jgi:hypothetical protein